MRKIPAAVLLGLIASLIANPAAGQRRLSDVAGSVKLKNPQDGQVVITNRSVETAPQKSSFRDTPYGRCLAGKVEGFGSELEELRGRVSNRETVARPNWFEELSMQCDVVIGLADEFASCAPDEGWQVRDHQELMNAVNAGRTIASSAKRWSGGDKNQLAAHLDRYLGEVIQMYEAAWQGLESDETPHVLGVDADLAGVLRDIKEYCETVWPHLPDKRAECVRQQDYANRALMSRNAGETGLSSSDFATIRSECLDEFEGNYKQRNDCERTKIREHRE